MGKDYKLEDLANCSDTEWQQHLTPEQFHVTRERGTERPFSGEFWNCFDSGTYQCICCGAALFDSTSKFDAGCGWPSFSQKRDDAPISEKVDHGFGMTRTEVICSRCKAHLGHVFPDGPQPTGLRYCINSASLKLERQDDESS